MDGGDSSKIGWRCREVRLGWLAPVVARQNDFGVACPSRAMTCRDDPHEGTVYGPIYMMGMMAWDVVWASGNLDLARIVVRCARNNGERWECDTVPWACWFGSEVRIRRQFAPYDLKDLADVADPAGLATFSLEASHGILFLPLSRSTDARRGLEGS